MELGSRFFRRGFRGISRLVGGFNPFDVFLTTTLSVFLASGMFFFGEVNWCSWIECFLSLVGNKVYSPFRYPFTQHIVKSFNMLYETNPPNVHQKLTNNGPILESENILVQCIPWWPALLLDLSHLRCDDAFVG